MKVPVSPDIQNTFSEIQIGEIIADRYTITAKLGTGGFAVVYRAFDREIERDVAIKILNLEVLSGNEASRKTMLERFRREARLAARIRHPNVVEIYDLGELHNQTHPYIIMEILEGHDLDQELHKHKGMPPTRALPLFCGALEALAEAHRMGIVHKDIKPANLFLNRPNTRMESLKVVDFGIAHIGGNLDSRLTQTGMIFGTPQYLPPEYIQNQIATPAMDVYQMALVLVEMLTGQTVVNEDSPWQCAMKHVMRAYSLPEPLLAGPLGPIITHALDPDHEIRYHNAEAFADALRQIDPTTIADVRGDNVPHRKFDTISGEWLPDLENTAMVTSKNVRVFPETTAPLQPDPQSPYNDDAHKPASQKSRNTLLIAIFTGLLLLISAAAYSLFFLLFKDDPDTNHVINTSPTPAIITPTTIAENPPTPEPEATPNPEPEPTPEPDVIPESEVTPEPTPSPKQTTKAATPKQSSKKQPTKTAPKPPEKPKKPALEIAP